MNTTDQRSQWIAAIAQLPTQLEHLLAGMTPTELTGHFLAGEWSVAQNVHHLADSHMNSYIRCKLIATEDNPPLKPYDQDAWAALPDAQTARGAGFLALVGWAACPLGAFLAQPASRSMDAHGVSP